MVHVNKCPCENGRSKPTTEFFKVDGKPQIYCYGWMNLLNDEYLSCCKQCDDWVYGERFEKDFREYLEKLKEKNND